MPKKPTIHELEKLLDDEGRHVRIEPDGAVKTVPTANEIRLASAIVHLIEYIDTGEPMDLQAADGVIGMLVPDLLQDLHEQHLLPLRRDGGAPFAIEHGRRNF